MNFPDRELIEQIGDIEKFAEKKIEFVEIVSNTSITKTILKLDSRAILLFNDTPTNIYRFMKENADFLSQFETVISTVITESTKKLFESHEEMIKTLKELVNVSGTNVLILENKMFDYTKHEWNEVIEALEDDGIKLKVLSGEELKIDVDEDFIQRMN